MIHEPSAEFARGYREAMMQMWKITETEIPAYVDDMNDVAFYHMMRSFQVQHYQPVFSGKL